MIFLNQILLVMLGGAIGSGARYAVYFAYASWAPKLRFPAGTLTVNIVGSFLITFITATSLSTESIGANTKLFLTAGIMGGFTTYSAFNNDLVECLRLGDYFTFGLNALLTFCTCLGAGLLALWTSRALFAPQ